MTCIGAGVYIPAPVHVIMPYTNKSVSHKISISYEEILIFGMALKHN